MTKAPRSRRRHRLVLPFLLLGLLYLITGVAHAVEEPDLDEPGTLAPGGTGPHGSARLAELLTARGVTVRRVTSSTEAVDAVRTAGGPTSVFVPAPDLLTPRFLATVRRDFASHRVVLLRPGMASAARVHLGTGPTRWATRMVAPGCATDFARNAGPAAVSRSSYRPFAEDAEIECYQGGVVGIDIGGAQIIAVGATDPFRNDRIDEAGNAALATGLLGRDSVLIWVDVHRAEPREPAPPVELPRYRRPDRVGSADNPLWTAFPPLLWAGLATLAGIAVLISVTRARRIGPPVHEPLPVVVPATETVLGRGRLYARIRARADSWATLRQVALRRIGAVCGRPDDGRDEPDDAFVARVAARSGIPPQRVRAALAPTALERDGDLMHAVAELDALVAAVLRGTPGTGAVDGDARSGSQDGGKL